MRPLIARLRNLQYVLVVAAAFVLLFSFWSRSTRDSSVRTLSPSESQAVQSRPQRPLALPGEYRDTVILFLDYHCPYCAALYPDLVRARSAYGVDVRHVVAGPNSVIAEAAIAAECARQQGRFHPYSYALFGKRDSIGALPWEAYGIAAGVPDLATLTSCVERRLPLAWIEWDTKLVRDIGLKATPTVVYGGRIYTGPLSIAALMGTLKGSAPVSDQVGRNR